MHFIPFYSKRQGLESNFRLVYSHGGRQMGLALLMRRRQAVFPWERSAGS